MDGVIEKETINGILSNDGELVGSLNNTTELTPTIAPISVQLMKDYNKLYNKPQINEVELKNNKSLEDLNVNKLTNLEIEDIINSIV